MIPKGDITVERRLREAWRDTKVAIHWDAFFQKLAVAGFKTPQSAFLARSFKTLAGLCGRLGVLWRAPILALLNRPAAPGVLTMDGLAATADTRRHGVGKRLLRTIGDEAHERQLAKIRLDVIDNNSRAEPLNRRLSFVPGRRSALGPLRHPFGFHGMLTMTKPADRKAVA